LQVVQWKESQSFQILSNPGNSGICKKLLVKTEKGTRKLPRGNHEAIKKEEKASNEKQQKKEHSKRGRRENENFRLQAKGNLDQ